MKKSNNFCMAAWEEFDMKQNNNFKYKNFSGRWNKEEQQLLQRRKVKWTRITNCTWHKGEMKKNQNICIGERQNEWKKPIWDDRKVKWMIITISLWQKGGMKENNNFSFMNGGKVKSTKIKTPALEGSEMNKIKNFCTGGMCNERD